VALTCTVETPSLGLQPRACWPIVTANATLGVRPDFMPANKAVRFPRTARLLRHADFERVYKQGRRHFSDSMTVFYWPRPRADAVAQDQRPAHPAPVAQGLRVGFTVGRALGGAVQRNRMKRRLREAVRITRPVAGVAADVVINPKKSLLTTDFADVVNEVSRAFVLIEQKLAGQKLAGKMTAANPGSRTPDAGSRSGS
jgi:ribonuclease P protein component